MTFVIPPTVSFFPLSCDFISQISCTLSLLFQFTPLAHNMVMTSIPLYNLWWYWCDYSIVCCEHWLRTKYQCPGRSPCGRRPHCDRCSCSHNSERLRSIRTERLIADTLQHHHTRSLSAPRDPGLLLRALCSLGLHADQSFSHHLTQQEKRRTSMINGYDRLTFPACSSPKPCGCHFLLCLFAESIRCEIDSPETCGEVWVSGRTAASLSLNCPCCCSSVAAALISLWLICYLIVSENTYLFVKTVLWHLSLSIKQLLGATWQLHLFRGCGASLQRPGCRPAVIQHLSGWV